MTSFNDQSRWTFFLWRDFQLWKPRGSPTTTIRPTAVREIHASRQHGRPIKGPSTNTYDHHSNMVPRGLTGVINHTHIMPRGVIFYLLVRRGGGRPIRWSQATGNIASIITWSETVKQINMYIFYIYIRYTPNCVV